MVLRAGARHSQGELLETATAAGMRKVPLVTSPGEISQRGDVVDVFPLAAPEAWRLEFFDGQLESIRIFDPASQRSLGTADEVVLDLCGGEETSEVLDHLPRPQLLVLDYERQSLPAWCRWPGVGWSVRKSPRPRSQEWTLAAMAPQRRGSPRR
jgi:hypothetical protein